MRAARRGAIAAARASFSLSSIAWTHLWNPASITVGDGNAVDVWPDTGSAPDNFEMPTVGDRPIFESASANFNGKPTVIFDGVNHYMVANTNGEARPQEWVIIGRVTGPCDASDRILGDINMLLMLNASEIVQAYGGSIVASTYNATSDGFQPHLFRMEWPTASADTRLYVDEVSVGCANAGALNGSGDLAVGGSSGGANNGPLELALIGTVPVLTPTERANLFAWATAEYAL